MSLSFSTTSAMLKEMYPVSYMEELGYFNNPVVAVIPKDTSAGGDQEKIPVDVSPVQGASATFTSAQTQAAARSSEFQAFEVTTIQDYALARVSGKMIRATANKKAAFAKAMDKEMQNAFRTFRKRLGIRILDVGDGALGAVGTSGITTTTCTLAHESQAHRFELGMEVAAAADNTSALRDGGNTATITGINRSDGELTTDANWTGQISGMTDDDLIFPVGDYVSSSDRLCCSGFEAWVPETVTATTFFGVNRTKDEERLAGVRYDGSADTLEEALINGQSEGAANGDFAPDYCFVANYNLRKLLASIGSKKVYFEDVRAIGSDGNEIGHISFKALVLQGDAGPIKVMACPWVPYDVAWMISKDTWKLHSMGALPGLLEEDGNVIRAVYNADMYEVRVGGYYNLACYNPASNVRIKLA